MCGIAGIITAAPQAEVRGIISRMVRAQAHRGPDDEGIALLPAGDGQVVALGNCRLAIIDLSPAGHQPMTNEDSTIWLTFNGEIYNFAELREELIAAGHSFRSGTDTETIVHGYEQWGIEGLLQRLNGMFALALWDAKTQTLWIARDRFGEKPVYYIHHLDTFLFASELHSLRTSGQPFSISKAGIAAYLSLGAIPGPHTILEGVGSLPAACYLSFNCGTLRIRKYWRLRFGHGAPVQRGEMVARTRSLLDEAVNSRLVSDVPVGVFLSGGIDSSSLVALTRSARLGRLTTTSVVFDEANYSEASYAEQIARKFETDHVARRVGANEVLAELPRMVSAMDQPTVDGINTYFVSMIARQAGTVVALSGLGADELFGGYTSFTAVPRLCRFYARVGKIPGFRRVGSKLLPPRFLNAKMQRFVEFLGSNQPEEAAYFAVRGLFPTAKLRKLAPDVFSGELEPEFDPLASLGQSSLSTPADLRDLVSHLELTVYMQSQLLRDTDVMSMAHSLEVRVPFLDYRLAEFVAGIPAPMRFDGRPKALLIEALDKELPPEIVNRPKHGFTFPFDQWFRRQWRDEIEATLLGSVEEVLEPAAVRSIWQEFLAGLEHWSRPWLLYVLTK